MSSLRNSLHRRNHKERSQLSNRSRLGLLEKHKDYVLRAADYNSKKERIRKLRQRAGERNKDEFYFGMVGRKTQKGVHMKDRGNESLPTDLVKVLKTQDENYLRTVRTQNIKRMDKIKEDLSTMLGLDYAEGGDREELHEEDREVLIKAGVLQLPQASGSSASSRKRKAPLSSGPSHVVFVDDETQAAAYEPPLSTRPPQSQAEEPKERMDLGWIIDESVQDSKTKKGKISKRPISEEDVEMDDAASHVQNRRDLLKHRSKLIGELSERLLRDQSLRYAIRELEMQRILMGKGAAKKIRGPEKVEEARMNEDEEDELFARTKGKRKVSTLPAMNMEEFKPRVYKFRAERKK